jgi:Ribbon-helix-helix protein, copG family
VARMQRTQIYLDPEMSAALGRLARKRRTTKAGLIRLATRRLLEQEDVGEEDPILGIIGLGDSGQSNLSLDHDEALTEYELSRRSR